MGDVITLAPMNCVENIEVRKPQKHTNLWDKKLEIVLERIDELYVYPKLRQTMKDAVLKVFKVGIGAVKAGFPLRLVLKAVDKKCLFILDARSIDEVNQILKLSVSRFEINGFVTTGKYHIPEEELMLLVLASKQGKLTPRAQERFVQLYELCMKAGRTYYDEVDE